MNTKISGFTIKRPRKGSSNGFGLWVCNTRRICYEEPLQTSCLGNHWFYCVFAQIYWKSIGFIDPATEFLENPLVLLCFRSKYVEKQLVLLCFRSTMLKNHWFYKQRCLKTRKTIGFTVKPIPATAQQPATGNGQRIRALVYTYSLDTLWGTLTDKLFREKRPGTLFVHRFL